MKKNEPSLILKILAPVLLLLLMLIPTSAFASTNVPDGFTSILEAPSINIVGKNSNIEISGDYASYFQLTKETSYEVHGLNPADPYNIREYRTSMDRSNNPSVLYRFDPNYTDEEKYIIVKNAGLFQGEKIDLRINILEQNTTAQADGTYANLGFTAISYADYANSNTAIVGSNGGFLSSFLALGYSSGIGTKNAYDEYTGTFDDDVRFSEQISTGDSIKYNYEIYYAGTNQLITDYKGFWNFTNINSYKTLTLPVKAENNFNDLFVYSLDLINPYPTTESDKYLMGYRINSLGEIEIKSNSLKVLATNNPEGEMSRLLESPKIEINQAMTATTSDGGSRRSGMLVFYVTDPIVRIAPATPIVIGETNDATNTDPDYGKLKYRIVQTVVNNKADNRDEKLVIQTTLPDKYELSTEDFNNITITNYGTDVNLKDLFEITQDGKTITFTAKDPDSDAFVGNVFDISIEASRINRTGDTTNGFKITDFDVTDDNYEDNYMHYQLGGLTKTTYTYSKAGKVDEILTSVADERSIAEVLYQATPYADPILGLTIPFNTDIAASIYSDPESIIKNLRLDTGESILDSSGNRIIDVSYDSSSPSNSGLVPGAVITLIVLLETKDGIQNTVEVPITVGYDSLKNVSATKTQSFNHPNDSTKFDDVTKVGADTIVTYTINIANNETVSSGLIWESVDFTDEIDEGLTFDVSSVRVDGAAVTNATYIGNLLTVPLGDIGPGVSKEITFTGTVKASAIGNTITNMGHAAGVDEDGDTVEKDTDRVDIPTVRNNALIVHFVDTNNPTGTPLRPSITIYAPVDSTVDLTQNEAVQDVIAELEGVNYEVTSRPSPETITITGDGNEATYEFESLGTITVSAPSVIDFKSITYNSAIQKVSDPDLGGDKLVVTDTRSKQETGWTLQASLTREMTNVSDSDIIMKNALMYRTNDGTEKTLSSSAINIRFQSAGGNLAISDAWGTTEESEGLKLVYDPKQVVNSTDDTLIVSSVGSFSGEITWTVIAGPVNEGG